MMRIFIIFTITLLGLSIALSQGIAINDDGDLPHSSAALDVSSTNRGMLIPRMSEANRDAIATPAIGLMIYNLDSECINYYSSSGIWVEACGKEEPPIPPPPFQDCGDLITFNYAGNTKIYGTVEKDYSSLPPPYNAIGTKCWMDRNLGATKQADFSTDEDAYGDLFQWGRLVDGHQNRNSALTPLGQTSSTDNPGHGDFIRLGTLPVDWRAPQNDLLWEENGTGINNPCPSGWRVPTKEEWEAEVVSWGVNDNATGAINSSLRLPVAGWRRNDGGLNTVGSTGNYWSSTTNGTNAYRLIFNNASTSNAIVTGNGFRAYGHAVRCIKN
ncbi:MAG: hypothetical protein JJT77_10115 [Crocinitomicaceae bacterium]|nr:hypothetical protein [Crocinitomicaceae bacterium]